MHRGLFCFVHINGEAPPIDTCAFHNMAGEEQSTWLLFWIHAYRLQQEDPTFPSCTHRTTRFIPTRFSQALSLPLPSLLLSDDILLDQGELKPSEQNSRFLFCLLAPCAAQPPPRPNWPATAPPGNLSEMQVRPIPDLLDQSQGVVSGCRPASRPQGHRG